ncbi:uncharacterized protein LOC100575398 isoform X1 [Acyrthosiphon pisum]|uniref:ACYPI44516 protein n=1 Tax=Acyrthosiphon pisum TaxID=7029 RepID=C4WTA9_ACYPI|nr:uncharacterized protein LOC100575398 precursor [Acyrthosiphon pisum]XP_008178853.1 uncharacterized protein LOC100575398 isoform X1 [Acyrthosiphon pisum]XP_008178855.1 uncharacterized protein LOC100575398 isoform X1 [Acyrthosiphon pisum]BAH71129.1 ACYPI44516 [Acyrthosiphon pisum]|eukprot:NP_001233047.1 uncharacterized protein LOC100575398 precursor [Acyrthosiphon pisum]
MNLLFLLLVVCIAMVAYGRDSRQTSTKSQLQISPKNIKMDSEGKNRINDNYILYSRKNSAAKTAYDAVNKRWTRDISTQKVKETLQKSNKMKEVCLNTLAKIFQVALIRPKLRPCPAGMVRGSRGECVFKFFNA